MRNLLLLITILFGTFNLFSQENNEGSVSENNDDLAAKIQNPIASLISIPFQNNSDIGEDIRPTNTLNIQPVIPFKLSEGVNLITRTIIPIVSHRYIQKVDLMASQILHFQHF